MKKLARLGCGIATLLTALPVSQAEPGHCFRNVSLKSTYSVRFDRMEDKVAGAFVIESDDGAAQEYPFTGAWHARRLEVKFPAEKLPAILTREKPLVWHLVPTKGGDTLQVRIYGQNYQTKKFSNYNITLTPCDAKTAN